MSLLLAFPPPPIFTSMPIFISQRAASSACWHSHRHLQPQSSGKIKKTWQNISSLTVLAVAEMVEASARGLQSLSCYIHLPSIMLKQEENLPSHKVWIQYNGQNRSMRVAVKTVHFPIDRVLHLSSKFYLNPLTLVKYSKLQ